jgi:hypothetical protein
MKKFSFTAEVLFFINYYNKLLGFWEPGLEVCKLLLKSSFENSNLYVNFQAEKVLNFNFSYHFALCLFTFSQKIFKDSNS